MPASTFDTHDVFNQPPPFPTLNAVEADPVLVGALDHALDAETEKALIAHGAFWGSFEARELARLANTVTPALSTHDAQGRRIDQIEHHPAYHALMRRSSESGVAAPPVVVRGPANAHAGLLRTARLFVTAQTEPGHLMGLVSTHAVGPLLDRLPDAYTEAWTSGVATRRYDHRAIEASAKAGLTLSLAITEKQGGVEPIDAATLARAVPTGLHHVTGHKWFVTHPTSDGAVILAESGNGPSALLVPRIRSDGSMNAAHLMRLKPTLGLKAMAIGEVEYANAEAILIGDEGEGAVLLDQATDRLRLDIATIACGQMRSALAHAVHYCKHRTAGGERLIDLDLTTRVLADMAIDVAAATVLVMRLSAAADGAGYDPLEAAFLRLVLPAAKYWITKTAIAIAAEALECTGGNGFVEQGGMPQFYRDAVGLSLWAGPGNVLALDLLKVLDDDAQALDAVIDELSDELGRDGAVSADVIRAAAAACQEDRGSARILIEQLALAAAAAALHRYAPRAITGAFIDTRLSGPWRMSYGMLDGRYDCGGIVEYAFQGL
jgi:putative acyl-CoA dehydrogenase